MKSDNVFSEELFRNPPPSYRGAPFWAWNGKLDKDVLKEQIDIFREMGFGGFHMHSRVGLSTPYLGDDFMDCVRFCNEYGKEQGMLTWLYDEDKWPSGYGGGFITENRDFRARYLLFSPNVYQEGHIDRKRPPQSRLTENGTIHLVARYEIHLSEGRLVSYRWLKGEEGAGKNIWYAYEVIGDKLPWFNNAAYVDTMNPDATKKFAEVVYDRYKEYLGEEFSKSVWAIFTDEPQFTKLQAMEDGKVPQDAGIPYTKGMDEAFRDMYGYGFFEKMPEIFWERADGILSEMKYHYHNFIAQRFADSYAGVLGEWCERNHLMLTGHLMNEDSLERQTQCVGDVMRSYPFFQMPGIDILADYREYNTAKQAQSVARQEGKPGIASELYGVTNWNYDFKGHKLQGDWQAALGVTVRIPHLAWLYMGGESKRDYPAPIDAHSPWYKQYSRIENHFSRVNTVLSRGRASVRIGVLHPIESYWMLFGPARQCGDRKKVMEEQFAQLSEWLMFHLLDFDFLSEGLLVNQKVHVENGRLHVGEMVYEAVIIPELITIRGSTLEILNTFRSDGGRLILLGRLPEYVDAKKSDEAFLLQEGAVYTGYDKAAILRELAPYRDLDIRDMSGMRPDFLIYQMREEKEDRWLYVAHGKTEEKYKHNNSLWREQNKLEFSVKGTYRVQLLDTQAGEIKEMHSERQNGYTVFTGCCYEQDSFLFRLKASDENEIGAGRMTVYDNDITDDESRKPIQEMYLPSVNRYYLEEANVLLLDQAVWRLDKKMWMPAEEILRLDHQVRASCGMRLRTEGFPQPWLSGGKNRKEHVVELRFEIRSEVCSDFVELAFEGDRDTEIWWNDIHIPWDESGYYVDRAIHRVPLGALKGGINMLKLRIPFGENTNLEWCYLLGDFGVRMIGRHAVITKREKRIGFGDYAVQGMPFYGGNLVYEVSFETQEGIGEVEIPNYEAALLGVTLDGGDEIPIYMAPYRAILGKMDKGKHTLQIRSYGNRFNQFGQVHNCNPDEHYFSPGTWRTQGRDWCYEYRLKQCGVLTAPIIKIYKKI